MAVNDRIVDEKSPALRVGLDGPLSLVPHLALLPMVRLHMVNHTQTDSGGWSSRSRYWGRSEMVSLFASTSASAKRVAQKLN